MPNPTLTPFSWVVSVKIDFVQADVTGNGISSSRSITANGKGEKPADAYQDALQSGGVLGFLKSFSD